MYFVALQLNARFYAAAKLERMLASTVKGMVGQKIWDTVGHSCCRPIIIIS